MGAQLMLALMILVTLHELGHYLAARAFGIRVEKFYLFFDAWGFKFFSFRKGDTEYGIGWLPLGGYVKIAGMVDESLDKEAMKQPPQPWEFRSKPAWQRLIVMVGGVTMNTILGILIYTFVLLHYNKDYLPNENIYDGVYAYNLGTSVGLQNNDRITEINGKPFTRFEDLLSTRVLFGADLTVIRDGKTINVTVPDSFYRQTMKFGPGNFISPYQGSLKIDTVFPGMPAITAGLRKGDRIYGLNGERIFSNETFKDRVRANKGQPISLKVLRNKDTLSIQPVVTDTGTIGVLPLSDMGNYEKVPYTIGSAISFGTSDAFEAVTSNVKGIKQIFKGKEKASDSLQGPIGIATIFGGTWIWARFWTLTGLLSMVLALINMLPVPALDGGHVLFLLIESVTRKRFSDAFMEKAQVAGMIILLSLTVFVMGNDIWKHIIK
jgi:regulator of sigma E protease